ncbi:HD domain-containing protein [Vibrio sp. PP-XX7]
MQQKTQVFPLEKNASVRSRLTHSLEVQQVGRHIVQRIYAELRKHAESGKDAGPGKNIHQYGLADLERHFESVVEMGCLMHDVGNPPFGHFQERAINDWFQTHLTSLSSPLISPNRSIGISPSLKAMLRRFVSSIPF